MSEEFNLAVGDVVTLDHQPDAIVPGGVELTVTAIEPDGSIRLGGNTCVWPERIVSILRRDHEERPPWQM